MKPDVFCAWLCGETAYATQNFTVKRMFDDLEQGVSRRKFSYRESVLRHLGIAGLLVDRIYTGDRKAKAKAGLRLTQSLGKATLNLVTLSAIAAGAPRDKFMLVHALAIEEAGGYLQVNIEEANGYLHQNMPNQAAIRERIIQVGQAFDVLQAAQDSQDSRAFRRTITSEIVATGALFVGAATAYGLPRPGLASGKIKPWLDMSVQRDVVPVV